MIKLLFKSRESPPNRFGHISIQRNEILYSTRALTVVVSWTTVDGFEDLLGNGRQIRQSFNGKRSYANGKGDGDVEGLEAPYPSEDSILKG